MSIVWLQFASMLYVRSWLSLALSRESIKTSASATSAISVGSSVTIADASVSAAGAPVSNSVELEPGSVVAVSGASASGTVSRASGCSSDMDTDVSDVESAPDQVIPAVLALELEQHDAGSKAASSLLRQHDRAGDLTVQARSTFTESKAEQAEAEPGAVATSVVVPAITAQEPSLSDSENSAAQVEAKIFEQSVQASLALTATSVVPTAERGLSSTIVPVSQTASIAKPPPVTRSSQQQQRRPSRSPPTQQQPIQHEPQTATTPAGLPTRAPSPPAAADQSRRGSPAERAMEFLAR